MYRQGDVLLIHVSPNTTTHGEEVAREHGRLILAKGDATGHHHSLASRAAALYMLGVPPTMTSAREALAWTFDVPVGEYKPTVET